MFNHLLSCLCLADLLLLSGILLEAPLALGLQVISQDCSSTQMMRKYSVQDVQTDSSRIEFDLLLFQIPLLYTIWPVLHSLYHTSLTITIFCTLAITTERYQVTTVYFGQCVLRNAYSRPCATPPITGRDSCPWDRASSSLCTCFLSSSPLSSSTFLKLYL